MSFLLPTIALLSTSALLFYRWRNWQETRRRCGAESTGKAEKISWGHKITSLIKREADYAVPDVKHVYPVTITAMLIFMLIGVVVGQIFKSYFFSLVLMILFGAVPWAVLRYLSIQKLMRLEMELPTFVTDLVHHLRDKKDMKLALQYCDFIPHIRREQEKMVSDLGNNYPPDEALKRMYERTRSRWFLLISQIAAVMEKRSELDAIVKQFMVMQVDIQRANGRIQKAFHRTKKKARMLILIEVIFFGTLYITVNMIQDPWYYFTSTDKGQTQLFIGFVLAVLPIVYLIYLLLRRR